MKSKLFVLPAALPKRPVIRRASRRRVARGRRWVARPWMWDAQLARRSLQTNEKICFLCYRERSRRDPPTRRRVVCRRVARGRRQVARPVLPRRLVA
jgi:hypothetical protein